MTEVENSGYCQCDNPKTFWEEYDIFTLDYQFKRRVKEKICSACHKSKFEELIVIKEG